jgi:prepilin-type N-terminal cleavage/methylation domain-containing protein
MKLPHKLNSIKKQIGLTLIELSVALAVAALIIGGALMMASTANTSQGTTQTVSEMNAIHAAVKGLYYGQGSYGTGSLNSVLIASNKLPSTISVSGTTLTNGFQGTITITGATSQFTVTNTGLPTSVCVGLLASAGATWSGVTVAGTAVTLPTTPAAAATACSVSATPTLVFTSS